MSTRSRSNPGGARVLELMGEVRPFRERKPAWFKRPAPGGPRYRELRGMIESEGLHTVCQEAACPNIGECWERGTATFMILGDTCTRRCGFCNVKTGKPTHNDPLEPLRVAQSVKRMGLRHAVITSVDRDDLPDLGASAFVGVIRSIRRFAPGCKVEVLTPDFRGEEMPLARVIAERPDVFNHNVETVPRLYPLARRGSRFLRSCRVLRNAKEMGGDEVVTKSGLMTGLGETKEELLDDVRHPARARRAGAHGRPVPAPDARPPAGGALLAPRRVRRARARGLRDGLRVRRGRARSCARATTPSRPWSRPRRADAHAPPSRRPRSRGPPLPAAATLLRAQRGRGGARWAGRSTWSGGFTPGGADDGGGRALRHRAQALAADAPDAGRAEPSGRGGRTAAGSTCTAATRRRPRSPPRAATAAPLQPGARPLAAAAAGPHAAGGPRARPPSAPACMWRAGQTTRGSLRSLEIYDFARRRWSQRPELPGAGAQPHDRRRPPAAVLRAGRARTARNSRARRALRPAPARPGRRCRDMRTRARRHRVGAAARRPHCGVRRRGAALGRHDDRGGRAVRPAERRWSRLPDMRTPRHGLGGAALGRPRVRDRGRAWFPGSRFSDDRVPGRARRASRRDPAQGRHPDPALPGAHGRADRDQRDRLLRLRARALGPGRLRQRARVRVRRDPLRDHASRDDCSADRRR